MGLFDRNSLISLGTGLFSQYTGVQLTPAGTAPVQATLPANRTGTPAQDPLSGPGSNGVSSTAGKYGTSLFSGGVNPLLLVVGSIVVVAAIVMVARR